MTDSEAWSQTRMRAVKLGQTRRGQRVLHLLLADAANLTATAIATRSQARFTALRLLALLENDGLVTATPGPDLPQHWLTEADLPRYRLTEEGRGWVRWLLDLEPRPDHAAAAIGHVLAHCREHEQRGTSYVKIAAVRALLGGDGR